MSRKNILLSLLTAALGGCTTGPMPEVSATHPASPSGPEGEVQTVAHTLREDDLTRKARVALAEAAKAQKEWDEHGPVSGTPAEPVVPDHPTAAPGVDHSQMKGMNHASP